MCFSGWSQNRGKFTWAKRHFSPAPPTPASRWSARWAAAPVAKRLRARPPRPAMPKPPPSSTSDFRIGSARHSRTTHRIRVDSRFTSTTCWSASHRTAPAGAHRWQRRPLGRSPRRPGPRTPHRPRLGRSGGAATPPAQRRPHHHRHRLDGAAERSGRLSNQACAPLVANDVHGAEEISAVITARPISHAKIPAFSAPQVASTVIRTACQ